VILVIVAVISFAATYAYANYFGPKTVLQTNSDKFNCRQGNDNSFIFLASTPTIMQFRK
jgi:hypothetical protein